jgi:hypothetical protein
MRPHAADDAAWSCATLGQVLVLFLLTEALLEPRSIDCRPEP